MRKYLLALFCVLSITSVMAQSQKEVNQYKEKVLSDQREVVKLNGVFMTALEIGFDSVGIKTAFSQLVNSSENLLEFYQTEKASGKTESIQKSMVDFLLVVVTLTRVEYKDMVTLYLKNEENLTRLDFSNWLTLSLQAGKKYEMAVQSFKIEESSGKKPRKSITDKAIIYNDEIVAEQKQMLELESNFVNAIVDGDDEKVILKEYDNYVVLLETLLVKYQFNSGFKGDKLFSDAMFNLVECFRNVAQTEYKEMVEIYTKPAEDLTEADFERWEFLTNVVDEKEGAANEKFLDAQQEFAKKYHYTLQ